MIKKCTPIIDRLYQLLIWWNFNAKRFFLLVICDILSRETTIILHFFTFLYFFVENYDFFSYDSDDFLLWNFILKKTCGFTLIEFLITVSVVGIVAAIAVPSFVEQLKKMEAQSVNNILQTFLVNAKQDAMIYQNILTICAADANRVCVARNGEFLLSFIDKNGNHRFDDGVDALREFTAVPNRYGKIRLSVGLNRIYVDFKPQNGNPIGHMGHIKYCPNDLETQNMFKVTFSKQV